MINNDIITKDKLNQYKRVLFIETWDEVIDKIDINILGEMDWYLIDGLMDDYLMTRDLEESEQYSGDVKRALLECCDTETTITYFKKIASNLTVKE